MFYAISCLEGVVKTFGIIAFCAFYVIMDRKKDNMINLIALTP